MDKTPEPYIACIKCGDEVPQSTVSKRNWCAECEDENSLLEIERDME
jgi:ribosomal protein S26